MSGGWIGMGIGQGLASFGGNFMDAYLRARRDARDYEDKQKKDEEDRRFRQQQLELQRERLVNDQRGAAAKMMMSQRKEMYSRQQDAQKAASATQESVADKLYKMHPGVAADYRVAGRPTDDPSGWSETARVAGELQRQKEAKEKFGQEAAMERYKSTLRIKEAKERPEKSGSDISVTRALSGIIRDQDENRRVRDIAGEYQRLLLAAKTDPRAIQLIETLKARAAAALMDSYGGDRERALSKFTQIFGEQPGGP